MIYKVQLTIKISRTIEVYSAQSCAESIVLLQQKPVVAKKKVEKLYEEKTVFHCAAVWKHYIYISAVHSFCTFSARQCCLVSMQ